MLKKKLGVVLVAAMALCLWSGASFASFINVGGVVWDPSVGTDLTVETLNLRETSVEKVGDKLIGYGRIGSINGNFASNMCPGCDLTFVFNYTVSAINGQQVVLSGGTIDVFVGTDGSYNINDPSTADDGTLWLSLKGHEAAYAGFSDLGELYSSIMGPITDPANGSYAFGLLDVVGGLAAGIFDTNTQADGADLTLNSSFQTKGDICGVDVTTGEGELCYPIGGQAGLVGATAVPAPAALGLMGFGMLAIGFLVQRRRKDV